MQDTMFGSLVVRLQFTAHRENNVLRSREVRLITFHGTLEECTAQYTAWLMWNPRLEDFVRATFEVRMAVHLDKL